MDTNEPIVGDEEMVIQDGCLEVGDSEKDWILDGEVTLPPLFLQDEIRYEYHQGSTPHCTIYGPLGALSDLMNKEFNAAEIDDCLEYAFSKGKPRDAGRLTQAGVKTVCEWWNNKNPDNRVAFFRIDLNSNNMEDATNKNYTVVISYRGNSTYGADYYDDAIVEGISFSPTTYGHCTTMIKKAGNKTVKDSYKGRKGRGGIYTNYYQVKDVPALIKSGNYYPSSYLIVKEKNMDITIEEAKRLKTMELDIKAAMELNSKLRHQTNSDQFKDHLFQMNNVFREKLQDIKDRMTKFN